MRVPVSFDATAKKTLTLPRPFPLPSAAPRSYSPSPSPLAPLRARREAGWWGHNPATRFDMPPRFHAIRGAQGFQQSNPSVLAAVALLGSLEVFAAAGGLPALRARSLRLTGHLEALLRRSRFFVPGEHAGAGESAGAGATVGVTVITPADPAQRGAQLSLVFLPTGRGVMPRVLKALEARGVVGDSRKPDVIRLAPAPRR